jgi:hypothetical protein
MRRVTTDELVALSTEHTGVAIFAILIAAPFDGLTAEEG